MSLRVDGVYGYPCVTDPNDFSPDGESCSPEEIEAHRVACESYGKPSYQPNKGCVTTYDKDGKFVSHVLRTSWGIGMNTFEVRVCDDCGEPGEDFMQCHECSATDYCPVCWPKHERGHDVE